MRISAKCDYACRALFELSLHWPSKNPVQLQTISRKQKIPTRYLVQILIQLKGLGMVKSVRGKEGGYNLSLSPNKITLGEVIRQVGGPLLPEANPAIKKGLVFGAIWKEVEGAIAEVVDRITFEDIVNKARGIKESINYQI